MSGEKIRIGFVGVGQIAQSHLNNYRAIEGAQIVALSDINEDLLSRIADEHGVEDTYTDFRRMLDRDDIDAVDVLHFTNKQVVARRLASWALATVYGFNLPYASPIYDAMAIEGRSVRIQFHNAGSGLTTSDGRPPRHFKIAGPEGEHYPATARIDGTTVVLRIEHVTSPTTRSRGGSFPP